ncbi:anhydro-N-acetylmuramic acid kinase [Marinospirillum alkaliphilum]|nr:anhydro-N-acetylmuramic acid kinase [Marinospirillum alkaliphilum]
MSAIFAGLMSGTSLDAVDGVLVAFSDSGQQPRLLAKHSIDIDASLRTLLEKLAHAEQLSFTELATAEDGITRHYARCIQELLQQHGATIPIAIGCHGQTIEHRPDANIPYTLQLLNPSLLAELTGQNIICDFRRRDLAAGGQAAPLVPAFHRAVFHHPAKDRIAINLGGIANLSFIPADTRQPVTGFDTGPANLLLDYWHQHHWSGTFDPQGQMAASGKLHQPLLTSMLGDGYFSKPPPKSTGREHFNPGWLDQHLARLSNQPEPVDVLCTLSELTAISLTQGIKLLDPDASAELVVCGGGWFNTDLIRRIRHLTAPRPLISSHELGVDPQLVEAMAFAWLAWRHTLGRPGNLPAVTGAKGERILGGFYPA